MNYIVTGLLVVAVSVLLAVTGLAAVQRFVPSQVRRCTTTWPASSTPSWVSSTLY